MLRIWRWMMFREGYGWKCSWHIWSDYPGSRLTCVK
jgi:hypothetical protein